MQISQTINQIFRIYCHNKKIRNKFKKNQNSNQIFHIEMHQEYTSISEIDRILSKIHYKLCQHHHVTYQLVTKRQIIQMNRIIKISISRNKKKFKKELILIHFNYKKSAIINADASKRIIKAQLQQIDEKKQKQLITCYTQKLTSTK